MREETETRLVLLPPAALFQLGRGDGPSLNSSSEGGGGRFFLIRLLTPQIPRTAQQQQSSLTARLRVSYIIIVCIIMDGASPNPKTLNNPITHTKYDTDKTQ